MDAFGEVDGYAIACGTGIETPQQAKGDPRLDWRSLVIGFDLDGNRKWSRMDSYQNDQSEEAMKAPSSAAEYIFPMTGGRLGIVTDDAYGMGFEVLKAPDGQQCPVPVHWGQAKAQVSSTTKSTFSREKKLSALYKASMLSQKATQKSLKSLVDSSLY